MTLRDYLLIRDAWLRANRHPKTRNEIRVAVDAFCNWFGGDVDIALITPELAGQFEQADERIRRRQLASNLRGLLRLYDPGLFPRRSATLRIDARTTTIPVSNEKPGTLSEFAQLYVSRRSLAPAYANTLIRRPVLYETWLGKTVLCETCNEAALNAFLKSLQGRRSPTTVNKYRQDLLTLWNAAADDDLVPYPIGRRIRRERHDQVPIECYNVEEVRAIIMAAEQLKGCYENGIARSFYWLALVRFAWDTGLRRGDCWRFEKAWVRADGTFRMVQNKTRRIIRRRLRRKTLAAINRIDAATPLAWPLKNEWSFGFQFKRLIDTAQIDRGTFKWLRRATGSHIESMYPNAGQLALGNTLQVFNSHYNADLAGDVLMPPAL
jgi:hypothetical protein